MSQFSSFTQIQEYSSAIIMYIAATAGSVCSHCAKFSQNRRTGECGFLECIAVAIRTASATKNRHTQTLTRQCIVVLRPVAIILCLSTANLEGSVL